MWPEGKAFAFTVFDDPDAQTLDVGREVYALLADLGFRTTKGTWPVRGPLPPSDRGGTCDEPEYREWVLNLQQQGFEIGWHNATLHTSRREETRAALDRFQQIFGQFPDTMAQHFNCEENLYWGDKRLTGVRRVLYNALTLGRNRQHFHGEVPGHQLYWGDLCAERIKYVRNFVFANVNTLAVCPEMPYHDPLRPLVPAWFASSEGSRRETFIATLCEASQDHLAESGGACIMYTHFGHGFVRDGQLDREFVRLMERLSRLGGWLVPVGTLLDYLKSRQGLTYLTGDSRRRLEWQWLHEKILRGSS